MTKSAKGTKENPGKNVKQKSGLNREMLNLGLSYFIRCLEYKLQERKGQLIRVDPKFTSQICSSCGNKDKKNRKSQAKFICTSCGHKENADINAARNILNRGQNLLQV